MLKNEKLSSVDLYVRP